MCLCVCVCVRLSRAFTRDNSLTVFTRITKLDQGCKIPWLRSLLFCGAIDHGLQREFELKSQSLPHFKLVRAISHHRLKSRFPNLVQKSILAQLRSLLIFFKWLTLILSFIFNFEPVLFYPTVRLLFICIILYISSETIASECSTSHMAPHINYSLSLYFNKKDFQWGPCWPIYRESRPSLQLLDWGRKIQNDDHMDNYYCKPELISWR